MSYWYLRSLKDRWELNESTTNKFDLPERGHLSGLLLKLTIDTATALHNYNNPFPMQRTTMRIVGNGNVEIDDLRGRQLQAMNFWDTGEMPQDHVVTRTNNALTQFSFIPFGRYLKDEKYGLILENFGAGVEFEETNTFSTTYYSDTESKLSVLGLFRKKPEPGLFSGGYFKKRQILNKDAASETQYSVKLPTRAKLRQIHLFSEPDLSATTYLPAAVPYTLLNRIWLGVKSKEEYILNNVRTEHFAQLMHQMYGREARTRIWTYAVSGGGVTDSMIYEPTISVGMVNRSAGGQVVEDGNTMWERCKNLYGFNAAGTATSVNCFLDTKGILYHGNVPLLFIDPMADADAFLDADAMKDVYVEFTEGSSSGNIYVVLDELQETYPS